MATTKKEGAPAKERPSRSSLTPTTMQNPRPRATRPSSPATGSSEKDAVAATAAPASARKSTPNYLKPTFSSCPDPAKLTKAPAAGTARAPQKTPPSKKGLDAKSQPQRSSSFNPPRAQKPALSSRSSFSERTTASKGKPSHLPRIKVDSPNGRRPGGGARSKCSSATSSTNASATSSPKAMTEETMSNEDKEAALDILNLDFEEHVLLEIPPVVEKTALTDEPAHEDNYETEEPVAPEEHEHVLKVEPDVEEGKGEPVHDDETDGSEQGKKEDDDAVVVNAHEEVPTEEVEEKEDAEKPAVEAEEKDAEEVPGESDGEGIVGKVECDIDGLEKEEETGVDDNGERVMLRVSGVEEEAAPPVKEKKKEPAPQTGKKEAPPAYNDVIEETASKLVEKRKSKVKALVGAFETVIVMDSGGHAQ